MKILYAAGNREGSYLQLKRYLPLFKSSSHQFKIAGYRKSVKELNSDYCLDSLLNFTDPSDNMSFNGNYTYFCKEIIKFSPDLIISDFDLHTSVFAIEKGIPLWQVSPALLYYSIPKILKRRLEIHKFNSSLISANGSTHKLITNILNGSDKKLVVSHFCDVDGVFQLEKGYEWCRPEFVLNQSNTTSYINMNTGLGLELADSFYNERYSKMKIENPNIETITGITCNIHYGLGSMANESGNKKINVCVNDNVKFLMEVIK